jgi:Uma2 family endonuclease
MDQISETSSTLQASKWATRRLFNVDEYYRMAQAGVFAENARIELIEGEILEMASVGGRHIGAIMALTELWILAAAGRFRVSIKNPLRLNDWSEPEPDVVLLRHRPDKYRSGDQPSARDAVLVVEVADSSLQYDMRVKLPLYARHGIAEYWIVDLEAATITVCRSPTHDGYDDIETYKENEQIEPLALPGFLIGVADVVTN